MVEDLSMVEDLLFERGIDVCQCLVESIRARCSPASQKSKRRWRWHAPKWTSDGRVAAHHAGDVAVRLEDRIEDLAGRAPAWVPWRIGYYSTLIHQMKY
jgi:hypothetical protein